MPLTIQQVSNRGTQHPAFSRLVIQTHELLTFTDLTKEDRVAVVEVCRSKLKPRLLKCEEIFDTLQMRLQENMNLVATQDVNPQVRIIPYVEGLEGEAENFAYEVKNYLRDLLGVFELMFGCSLREAKVWYDKGLVKWARRKFGPDDPLVKLLKSERPWCEEWIKIRNAIDHPGQSHGAVVIYKVRLHPDGFIPPSWSRDGVEPTNLFTHMQVAMHNMLTLAEDVIVLSAKKRCSFPSLDIFEIPERERDPNAPQRFKWAMKKQAFEVAAE
jgi:hypothetical protein